MGWLTVLFWSVPLALGQVNLSSSPPLTGPVIAHKPDAATLILDPPKITAGCTFNGKFFAYNATRVVENGTYVCLQEKNGKKNVWFVQSCTHRGKQIPLMKEVNFGNETVVCMLQSLPNGDYNFITRRMLSPPMEKPLSTVEPTAKPTAVITTIRPTTAVAVKKTENVDLDTKKKPVSTIDPVDPINCGTIADFRPQIEDKCFQKYVDNPEDACDQYVGTSGYVDTLGGPYTGTVCGCKQGYAQSGYNCTKQCNAKDKAATKCTGDLACFLNGTKPGCICIQGYALEGSRCTRQQNYCETCEFNCHMAQKCVNSGNWNTGIGYSCSECDENLGFKATDNGGLTKWCTNINECETGKHNCSPNARCEDKDPSLDNGTKYECHCPDGFQGPGTKCNPCKNIDECFTIPGICGNNSICTDTPGSYSCMCKPGYTTSSGTYSPQGHQNCGNKNECKDLSSPCMAFSTCRDTEGSYECDCIPGYVGDGKVRGCVVDDTICLNCDKATTTCQLTSAGTAYECACNANHTRNNETSCKPKTYCDKAESTRCAPNPKANCIDRLDGSGYDCICNPGYSDEGTGADAGKGFKCISTDPCIRSTPCALVANTICNRTEGSEKGYQCICKPGFTRQLTGRGNDSAPCFEENGPQTNNCTQCLENSETCTKVVGDTEGNLFQCSCRDGYMRPSGSKDNGYGQCLNVIECATGAHNCDVIRAYCIDDIPTKANGYQRFHCECYPGFNGTGTTNDCLNINECLIKPPYCSEEQNCTDLSPGYECKCKKGFTQNPDDPTKCIDIDECALNLASCNAFTTCNNTWGSYNCFCDIQKNYYKNDTNDKGDVCGFYNVCEEGLQGKKEKKACPDPNHICIPDGNTYQCKCKDGFVANGGSCANIDECRDEQKNGCDRQTTFCKDLIPGYECVCIDGYERRNDTPPTRCVDKDECSAPYFNAQDTCHANSTCHNTVGNYYCSCDDGFEQEPGSPYKPYCKPKNPCQNTINPCYGGDCFYNRDKAPFYICKCNYGLIQHNDTTCIDSKYCDETNFYQCPSDSKCKDRKCECNTGYVWKDTGALTSDIFKTRSCLRIEWCKEFGQEKCTDHGMKCNDTGPGTGFCFCDAGFVKKPAGCSDRDECNEAFSAGHDLCASSPNSECVNIPGSYMCICKDGWVGESGNDTNPVCRDIDECDRRLDNCSIYKNSQCRNLNGSFECICKEGFEPVQIGGTDKGRLTHRDCVWKDPCGPGQTYCIAPSKCDSSSGCAVCICPKGYSGKGTTLSPCKDIDECDQGWDNCTMKIEVCFNTNGSFGCNCSTGYARSPKTGKCEDINECLAATPPCGKTNVTHKTCNNTLGSYNCICLPGWIALPNGTCVDFDECSQPERCGPAISNICNNLNGSFECTCPEGYEKKCPNSKSCKNFCEDINECDTFPCSKNAYCHNYPGKYSCQCKDNYEGNATVKDGCKYISLCDRVKCKPNSVCISTDEENYVCKCVDGYVLEEDVCVRDPCNTTKCIGGTCIPRPDKSGKIVGFCSCNDKGRIYNNKTGECIPSNVCQCPGNQTTCTNSKACTHPEAMKCRPEGAQAVCSCFHYLKYNNQTKKCENCDFPERCIGGCPPGAEIIFIKDQLGFFKERDCRCPKGQIWIPDPHSKFNNGTCEIDKECKLSGYCGNKTHSKCELGICICDSDTRYVTDKVTGECVKIDVCELLQQQYSYDPCPGVGIIKDGRGGTCECDCKPGFKKISIGNITTCEDIDECIPKYKDPCYSKRKEAPYCVNTIGSYECTCNGTAATSDYVIDENGECGPPARCVGRSPCPDQTSCVNATGVCKCGAGYSVTNVTKTPPPESYDNEHCADNDECTLGTYICPSNSQCRNTNGSYDCICNPGFERKDAEPYLIYGTYGERTINFTCADIDECLTPKIACNTDDPNVKCFNTNGSYNCTCYGKYSQLDSKTCVGISDETAKLGSLCSNCSEHASCAFTVGSNYARNCTCGPMYEGTGVGADGCKPIDYCSKVPPPCNAIAKCIGTNPGYRCQCPPGYEGDGEASKLGCNLINYCQLGSNPCPKNTNCTLLGKNSQPTKDGLVNKAFVTCSCPDGYEFDRNTFTCIDVNECKLKKRMNDDKHTPCPPNANCSNTQGSFTCNCPDGYSYNLITNECDDIDECITGRADSCKLGTGNCGNTPGSWVCVCLTGYAHTEGTDKICEYVNKCNTTANPCNKTNSVCLDAFESGFRCQCNDGYQQSPNDPYKCVDINECTFPNNCSTLTQTCENHDGGYECHCRTGYHQDANGLCAPSVACNKTCATNAICVMNRDNSSSCKCLDHYKWLREKKTCSIEACKNTDCGEGGTCVIIQVRNDSTRNYQLPYRCECEKGYTLDPAKHLCRRGDTSTCEAEKLCGSGSCVVSTTEPGYKCSCPSTGCWPSCNTTKCHELAECRTAVRDGKTILSYCQCKDGYRGFGTVSTGCFPIQDCDERLCSKYAACQLIDGKSTCVCDSHYVGNGTYCVDRNECADGSNNCDTNADCMNIQGGFVCTCKPGYTGSGTKGNCKDINECDVTLRLSQCNTTTTNCQNTNGSYFCTCKMGYRNTTYPFFYCPDINECRENNTCGKHQCINLEPGYECGCEKGYKLASNRRSCDDINECVSGTNDCHPQATCTNLDGGFECTCKEGYTGNGKSCEIIDKCADEKNNKCNVTTTKCTMISGQPKYVCKCRDGFKTPAGQSEWFGCDDTNECLNDTVYDSSTTNCDNTFGSYILSCKTGYTNVHPQPSAQNVTCAPRDECSEDPAFLETKALLEKGGVAASDWRKWMVPPKNPNSGYALCYNAALTDKRLFASTSLPNCMNLEPGEQMQQMNTNQKIPFTYPTGFTCACPYGDLKTKPVSEGWFSPECQVQACNCKPGFKCLEGTCVCLDPSDRMRVKGNTSYCTKLECDSDYTCPPKLVAKQDLILCTNNTFKAKSGYRLVRNNVTGEVIDVVDIDECTENNGVDPCCKDASSCVGDYCVRCQNIPGSYNCAYRKGSDKFCERGSIDSTQCKCNKATCGYTLAWYYDCDGVNVTQDTRLDDPKYNQPLCSKFVKGSDFLPFPNLKALYTYIASLKNDNQNQLGCLFDNSGDDLTRTPMFNYWGDCTRDLSKVKCEGGGTPSQRSYLAPNILYPWCPVRFTAIPTSPAVGQPVGSDWSMTPACMTDDLRGDYYLTGDFIVSDDASPVFFPVYA